MAFDWLKKITGNNPKKARDNGTDRNAVIKRVVAAAADDVNKRDSEVLPVLAATATATAEPAPARAVPPAPRPHVELEIPRDKVAQRAFEIWIRKGRPFGTSDADWLHAEAELNAELRHAPENEPLPNKPR